MLYGKKLLVYHCNCLVIGSAVRPRIVRIRKRQAGSRELTSEPFASYGRQDSGFREEQDNKNTENPCTVMLSLERNLSPFWDHWGGESTVALGVIWLFHLTDTGLCHCGGERTH